MKNLKLTFAFILTFFISLTFAQEQPYFIIEENGSDYEMMLKVDDVENVAEVSVVGYYVKNGEMQQIDVKIANEDVENFIENIAQIHQLDGHSEFAIYTVSILDKQGVINTYPSVEVTLQENNLAKL